MGDSVLLTSHPYTKEITIPHKAENLHTKEGCYNCWYQINLSLKLCERYENYLLLTVGVSSAGSRAHDERSLTGSFHLYWGFLVG